WDVLPPEMARAVEDPYERARTDGVVASFEGQCPNAKNWVAGRMQPTWSGNLGVFLRDITTEKVTQMALHESEEQFRATFEQAPVGIAHVAADGQWLRVNGRLCEVLGYSRDVLLGQTLQEAMRLADLDVDLDKIEQALRGGSQSYDIERRFRRSNGELAWCHLTVSLLRNPDQTPKYFIVM